MAIERRRPIYLLFIVGTILLGLLSRTSITPKFIYPYIGDAFYALMFYWIVAFIFSNKASSQIFLISLICCFSIELSQLYQADWINTIRANRLGALVLGQGFLWSDLFSYTLGSLFGLMIEMYFYKPKRS